MPNKTPPKPAVLNEPDSVLTKAARGPPAMNGGFAVVGIGASAGGLEACKKPKA